MANTKYNGRWVLDTIGSVVAAGTSVRLAGALFFGADDVHTAVLQDGNSKDIVKFKVGDVSVSGSQSSVDFGKDGIIVDGLSISSISSSSILYVYLAKL